MTPTKIMGRQYQVVSFPVGSTFVSEVLKFPRDLAAFKALECGTASFKYIRAGVRLTVRIQSTLAQAGLLCVSWVPGEGVDTVIPQQATGNNAVLLNYSTQDSVEIDIPWLNPLAWALMTDDAAIATVYFHPIVPTRAPVSTDDFVTVVVYAQYIDCELTGPQVAQSSQEAYGRGMASTVMSPVFQTMDAVENVATGFTRLLGLLDKPDAPTNVRHVNTTVSDTTCFLSSDTVVPAVPYSVTNPLLLPNSYNLFPYGSSSMSLTQLAARPMWAAQKNITALGDRLEFTLDPFAQRTIAEAPHHDYLSLAADTCHYFRGSQKFFIHFCTDQFTSCRFRVGIHYGPWETAVLSSGDTMSRVVDVKGTTSTSVLIPYLMQTHWCTSKSTFPSLFIAATTAPIGANLPSTATITVSIYRAGGPDTQFAYPCSLGSADFKGKKEDPQVGQTSLNAHFTTSFEPILKGAHIGTEHGSCMTNEITSISQLLKTLPRDPSTPDHMIDFPYLNNHYFLDRFFRQFKYWRGSTRVYATRFPAGGLGMKTQIYQGGNTVYLYPELALPVVPYRLPSEIDGVHITLPWYNTTPYTTTTGSGATFDYLDKPVFTLEGPAEVVHLYVYPGDDFVLGHLLAPP